MYGANRLALGIFMIWIAGLFFFVAFTPGGIRIQDDSMNKGKGGERPAANPAEVLGFLLTHKPGG